MQEPSGLRAARRLFSIDALRGMAAMGVVVVHAIHGAHAIPFGPLGRDTLVGRALATVMRMGFIGVYLFFVISGFCIHLRWAGHGADGRGPSFVAFWKRRIFRLYPPYLVALVLYLVIGDTHRHLDSWFALDVGLHLVMAHNLIGATTYTMNLAFWTLALEEQLYLLYFVLLAMRRRWGWRKTIALCFLARVGWFLAALVIHRKLGLFLPVQEGALAQWFGWALGAVSVEYALGHVRLPALLTRMEVGLALLLATCTLYTLVDPGGGTLAAKGVWFGSSPLFAVAFFVIVNAFTRAELVGRAQGRWVRFWARIGIFSYSLYLVHELVLTNLLAAVVRYAGRPDLEAAYGVLLIPAAVAFGWVYFLLVERRFMRSPAPALSPVPAAAP